MLNVERLAAAYGDVQALWDVSLEVKAGEIVVLIGPNGAGKTTLLRTIAGLHRPQAGNIRFESQLIAGLPAHRIVDLGVILVAEGRRPFGGMSVRDNLELGAYRRGARATRERTLQEVFAIFPPLADHQHRPANTLSGGQQQMLVIGRALMSLPRLLLLDEPSLGLSPLLVEDIFDVVRRINSGGVTILLVEQNARQALELADRAYILEQGRIVGSGSGNQLLHDEQVRQAYLGYAPAGVGHS